jgi:dimethylhistidine N-methyltransferase
MTAATAVGLIDPFCRDVMNGLAGPAKAIPAKWLYDARGSELFDEICRTPEYYPTRTEEGILRRNGPAMARAIGPNATLVEFGSGSSTKTRTLLDSIIETVGPLHAYVPIDISADYLHAACATLAAERPGLRIVPVAADYTELAALPLGERPPASPTGFFPGSTIGNLTPPEARQFLTHAGRLLGNGGKLLIGVDLVKEKAILDAAYDDAAGVTAAFSLNLLTRINRELGANFDTDRFRHVAFFNPTASRIEIYIESLVAQRVRVCDRIVDFAAGERIHTEYSYKYTVESFQTLAFSAAWRPQGCWLDPDRLFSVHLLGR